MSASFNKMDLITSVAISAGVTKHVAEQAVNAVFNSVADTVMSGTPVRIAGFGTFRPAHRRPRRVVVNNKEAMTREYTTVGFSAYGALKQYHDDPSE